MLWLLLACTEPLGPDFTSELEPVQVAPAAAHADLASYGDGAVLSWVTDDGERRSGWLATLNAGGELSDPRLLPADDPVAGLARKPQLATDGDRVLVVWSTGDPRHSTVELAEAPAADADFTTRLLATGDADSAVTLVDQPDVHVASDGEAWVAFKAEVDHPEVELQVAREASDWAPTPLQPAQGTPCECCPHGLDFLPGGEAWLVLRANDRNLREIHEATLSIASPPAPGRDLALEHTAAVSRTGWEVQGCPFDGPAATWVDDARRLVAWVDPTAGPMQAWVAGTSDGGATWSDARPILGDDARIDQQPVLTRLGDGRVAAAVDDYWTGSTVLVGPASAWLTGKGPVADHAEIERWPLSRPLWDLELAPFGEGVLAVGVDASGALWAEPLSAER